MKILKNDWRDLLKEEFRKTYYLELEEFLKKEYRTKTIYPQENEIYNALELTSFMNTKVVILGQDPYHGPGQAHGLSFSVNHGIKTPPSLKNIFKELQGDLGYAISSNGNLVDWAKQGVLLLNTVLTVEAGKPNSHKGKGWEYFTDKIITCLNEGDKPVIFILWGKHAQQKEELITSSKHYIIKSPHPSPFSANRGFFGSKPFSKTNKFLREIGSVEIDWKII